MYRYYLVPPSFLQFLFLSLTLKLHHHNLRAFLAFIYLISRSSLYSI